jgi:glycosyl transferase family 25
MNINEFFEKAYCINLNRRPDRWLTSSEIFKKNNINVERFTAKDGNEINLPSPYKFELAGSISHLNLIKKAKQLNLSNVLIFEDDVEFIDDIQKQFSEKIKNVPDDWDMIYFGGNHIVEPLEINDGVYKIYWTYALQMYAVNSKFFDDLISFLETKITQTLNNDNPLQPSVAADYFMAQLHESKNCYVIKPHFTWQRENFSDIQEKITNYNFLK